MEEIKITIILGQVFMRYKVVRKHSRDFFFSPGGGIGRHKGLKIPR